MQCQARFLSTLSLRRATGSGVGNWPRVIFLSTLSLRRATAPNRHPCQHSKNFYPRSPCGERRGSGVGNWPRVIFLSTLSLRRATSIKPIFGKIDTNFYPRSPCGERRECWTALNHLLRFLSTLSLRRATVHYDNYNLHCVISIHALLAESDRSLRQLQPALCHFYPRSPCGERPLQGCCTLWEVLFLSTLSLRRATASQTNLPGGN